MIVMQALGTGTSDQGGSPASSAQAARTGPPCVTTTARGDPPRHEVAGGGADPRAHLVEALAARGARAPLAPGGEGA